MSEENLGKIIIYNSYDGNTKIEVKIENDTVWLTQQQMAELFNTSKQVVSYHIKNIYQEGELEPESTVKDFLTVQYEGERKVSRNVKYFNLDMIISLGYRIKSKIATHLNFLKWFKISYIMLLMVILLQKLYMKELTQMSHLWD